MIPRSTIARILAVFVVALAGCAATPPAAEPPSPTAEPQDEPAATEGPAEPAAPALAPSVKRADHSIPDDYSISNGDCNALGRKLGDLTRSDELAKVSPKVKEKLREKAMQSIDEAATKITNAWIESCEKNLVGKVTDPKSLKCALDARAVKAFDECLNGAPDPNAKK